MTTRFGSAILIALLAGVPSAHATCGWFGTQLECGLGARQIVIGTQIADDPAYASSMRWSSFADSGRLLDDRPPATAPFRIELQNVGPDPTLCRRFGNETYCP
jgi:hypothetical protein